MIYAKSRMVLSGRLEGDPKTLESAFVGLVASPSSITSLVRRLALSIYSTLSLRRLTLVWINAVDAFETIDHGQVRVVKSTAEPLDIIIDADSFVNWMSVAEVQEAFGKLRYNCPIVMCMIRWSRVLAHMTHPTQDKNVMITTKHYHTKIQSGHLSVQVPSIVLEQWTRTLDSIERVVMPSTIGWEKESREIAMIPLRALEMSVEQAGVALVFDDALDRVCERLAASVRDIKSMSREAKKSEWLAEWNQSMSLLGLVSLQVWVNDPCKESRGVWTAALNSWQDGCASWPL